MTNPDRSRLHPSSAEVALGESDEWGMDMTCEALACPRDPDLSDLLDQDATWTDARGHLLPISDMTKQQLLGVLGILDEGREHILRVAAPHEVVDSRISADWWIVSTPFHQAVVAALSRV